MSWNTVEIEIMGAERSQVLLYFDNCHHDVMTGFT